MHEAVLGIDHPGAYADATAGTDTTVELWCNDHLLSVVLPIINRLRTTFDYLP